jgi:tetratricopeptide (TPR) repeat protein/tRNA A-37 threonylcarbamoyl transferase component Bud32
MTDLQSQLAEALGSTYRLERELGGGGMSRVFLATETALGRQVVIKVLPPEMAAGVNQDRFRREIQLAARLQHPHIVALLSAGAAGDILYYVMPYIEGESLRVRLARVGELPVADAVRILREVTDALAYAHDRGVVHRDIKPDNIMLSRGHALVADFGVAKAVSESTGDHSLTSLGVALGTPAYMAPEQATADPHVDHRADLYSLGALAYEMLAGRPPFVGGSPQALLAAQVTQAPDKVSAHRHTVPAGLDTLVMRCLEKRPADRWQTATELLPHLDALLTPTAGTQPATAVPVVSSGTASAIRKAHPVRVAALFALASLVVLSAAWVLVQRLGLPSWVMPAAVTLLALGLPIMLLTAWRERQRLMAQATGTHAAPVPGLAGRLLTWRGAITGGGLAFGGLGLGTAVFMLLRATGIGPFATLVTAGVLGERDRLILADFVNRTGDSTLGTSLTEALRIDLTRSPVVRLMERNEVAATMRLMQRDPAGGVDEATAREVAQRAGAKAVVAGEVAPLGSGYVLSARLIGAGDSATLFADRETAANAGEIIGAVERLSKKVRTKIGESLKTIRTGQTLEEVTTASLPALREYSEGIRLIDQGRQAEAMTALERAVTVDSTFGMAWRSLGVVLGNMQRNEARRLQALQRAYDLRDHMPPREAAHAEAFYYYSLRNDLPRAIEAYQRLLANWPDDGIALNNLGVIHVGQNRFSEAEGLYRRALSLYPDRAFYNSNLLETLVGQKKLDAADSLMVEWAKRAGPTPYRLRFGALLAREQSRYDVAFARIDSAMRLLAPDARVPAFAVQGMTLRFVGRYREAERVTAQLIELAERIGVPEAVFQQTMNSAEADAFVLGKTDAAAARLDRLLARHPLDSMPAVSRPYGRLATVYVLAGRTDRAQSLLAAFEREVPADARDGDASADIARAAIALARGDAAATLPLLRAAHHKAQCFFCTAFAEGRAFERLSMPDSAIAAYERLANEKYLDPESRDFYLAAALRRLGELYETRGDRQKAIEFYGRFVDLWKNADEELQGVVRDVRRHMAELAGEPRR